MNNKVSKLTVPGEKLAVIEECQVGPGTYEESGSIFSEYIGHSFLDPLKKIILVKEIKFPLIPREGSIIKGIVNSVQDRMAIISIFIIDDKKVSNSFSGILNISNSSLKYEKTMNEVCKPGDIVKAKVENVKNRIPEVTTIGKELGVIIAYCSKCGGLLDKKPNQLLCKVCGNSETRKVSIDYGATFR